ncbi:RHH-type proline utilization regulon transcriptional repressor/proline dehydrogenase/delta 1-pyrroline-5-carboxylate dehydrogenase [Variovorax paradoxus]|uniref:trifunctional transcriptional regulator/proline dehydrogenase/L-glutamate gamma-semialdehyde dehydrogenase n=1 Tax=Variovorax atrisoli TaxID=3394203 RepID=UPI0011995276|nr:trifunctional transcriptional regulator/proline dehydrogenase/L-glutamate gamma-semialdehyde dehydrogenase [Variovorax paradoxus]MDR6519370.1 RHH-type proline utilization regulon transcriptional repressor/proline dehydrogenase/delta 1-pyrroline-5-carboxylate dehydrogenase [Variovorax paradoxus]
MNTDPLPSSFDTFADGLPSEPPPLRARITAACRTPEPQALPPLLTQARLPDGQAGEAQELAHRIARQLRERKSASGRAGLVQGLLQEYALSSQEGVALMCLAEALLRIPDAGTRDALIRDKIAHGQWQSHAGRSPSVFVNAATWGLLLTGKLVATHSESSLSTVLTRLIGKGGEPLIRKGVDMAMRMMGEQFVTGETIAQALANARELEAQGFRYSYDMLGEAALTMEDAKRYRVAYEQAIHAIGKASARRGVYEGPGISIKLSALHPRYSRAQHSRVMAELYPVLRELALLARQYDIGLNIDAEEADRLELSLDLLERLCFEPELAGWNGIGFVVQAYQKRCPFVIDFVVDLARRSGHRLMVRLVKGAYWDSEIKRAQLDGLDGYPVYTRKAYTDVSYLACARKLLDAPEAVYPQFATHNAHTLAAIYTMADPSRYEPGQYEFQCLHGMGEPLYEQVVGPLARPCRIYAPVGTHETLLAYLVRRLLENGANTSFVNRIADPTISLDVLVEDPVATVERMAAQEGTAGLPHPAIPLPAALYGTQRANSRGLDLASDDSLRTLGHALSESAGEQWHAEPMLAEAAPADGETAEVQNPADHRDIVGRVREATLAEVESAIAQAHAFAPAWAATPPSERAALLERAADILEQGMPRLLGLLTREAGKTYANAIAEVREAVDFLRYYAAQARSDFSNDTHRALGPMACISPWNFPLAIFTGQVAAALAAGNPVLAKPAEQTPLVAAEAVRVLWEAGIPRAAVQLLPGRGETVGAALVADARVQGVMFTGSTEVARILQKTLSQRLGAHGAPVPLIAETGGQNAMIVDSSALVEQVVADVMASAFDSAGQRCSALRVLCVQEEAADRVVAMLKGAMAEAAIGNPARLSVDVGPVIDAEARDGIERHVEAMRSRGHAVFRQAREHGDDARHGTFVMPTLIELDSIGELQREVFGPVLHLVRYRRRDLGALVGQINGTGYGLTLGVHTRIDETIAQVVENAKAGNVYVNRNIVGAVVGVQPFGGEGLSGTGPKAGGPLYMLRMLAARPDDAMARAVAGAPPAAHPALSALARWADATGRTELSTQCARFAAQSRSGSSRTLAGPTGERNVYKLEPREAVLCLAGAEADRLTQLAAVLAAGSSAIWPADAAAQSLRASLPAEVQQCVAIANDWSSDTVAFDAALHHGDAQGLSEVLRRIAARPGPIVGVRGFAPGEARIPLESLVVERAVSTNTAAAGGNASLMTIG